ncbi:alpha/beta fold hydrolase [Azorhizophilus paspali]|uniref:Alpha/beta fold hydrolase n=1 Tax=Azorhizophilus paspali TaxID=69963 RepID=A0ABV6SQ00_AZOPA
MRILFFWVVMLCSLPSLAASRCDLQAPTALADVGPVQLAYQSIGRETDPALVLVMGLGGQLIDWPDEVLLGLCRQGFRVIRFDNRDVGLSAWRQEVPKASLTYGVLRHRLGLPVSAPYALRDMARDTLGLMARLQVPRFHVLGVSMGGMIAQHMADLAPERVRSLTLIMTSSSALGLPGPSAALLKLLAQREAGSREVAIERQVELLAALSSPQVEIDREQLRRQAATAYDRAFNPEGVKRQILAVLAEPSRVELLERLHLPTLVVHGTADPLLPVMHGVHVAAHVRGSELRLIPGLAHRFQEAFKEPLLAAVLPYLRSQRREALARL